MSIKTEISIGSIVTISKGRKHSIVDEPSEHSKRLIAIDDLRNDNLIRFTNDANGTEARHDDVLIAWDGANAGTIGFGKSGFIGSTIARLRFKERDQYYAPFVGAFLRSKLDYLRQTATGATIPHINRSALESISFPEIDFYDQKRIAHLLSKVERLIAQRKQHLQQLDELLKSVFLEMFGDPVRNEKGWEKNSLRNFGSFKNGLNFSKGEQGIKIQYLGVGNFGSLSKIVDTKSLPFINLNELPSSEYFLKNGDLVFVRSNGNKELVGRCIAIYPDGKKMTYSGFCIRYRITSNAITSNYLAHLFRIPSFRHALLQSGQGANIQNINQQILTALKIPIPPIELQNRFASIVEKVESIKTHYQQSLNNLETLYNALSQKAFKGELDLSRMALVVEEKQKNL